MILIVDSGSTKADWISVDNNGKQLLEKIRTLGLNPAILKEKKIYKIIGVDLPKNFSKKYYSKNKFFLQNPTYKWGLKKGKGGWKKYYTKKHLDAFNLLGGKKLLKTFGYK